MRATGWQAVNMSHARPREDGQPGPGDTVPQHHRPARAADEVAPPRDHHGRCGNCAQPVANVERFRVGRGGRLGGDAYAGQQVGELVPPGPEVGEVDRQGLTQPRTDLLVVASVERTLACDGVTSGRDVVDYLEVGADVVQVDTAPHTDVYNTLRSIVTGTERILTATDTGTDTGDLAPEPRHHFSRTGRINPARLTLRAPSPSPRVEDS